MAENITAALISTEGIRSSRQMELVRLSGHAATQASGTVVFTDNPVDGDTLTLNGVELTFLDTPVDPAVDVQIGATLADTIDNLTVLAEASVDALLTVATYTSDETDTMTVTYDTAGTGGNAYTMATDSAGITLSGETLAGGTAATAAGDTSATYRSSMQRPSFCVGFATISSVSGQSVVFKSLVALGGDQAVVRLYSI